jgi:alpha-2-macroglobulin-like protein
MTPLRLVQVVAVWLLAASNAKPTDVATAARLGGDQRVLTFISTDKPVYKAGETVYVRGIVLDARTRAATVQSYAQVSIKGPKGEVLMAGASQVSDGAFGFSWKVPAETAGGEFSVLGSGAPGSAPGQRKFDVRVYRPPRLKSQIVFARDGYGASDTLTATLETTRAEGGVPTGARITATARVDGANVGSAPCALDGKGRCTVSLKLPAAIERGEGTLSFVIEDGGVIETATKTIPLLVTSFDIALYPEGGDLVAGLTSRIYLEARTLTQKPADIAGVIVDSKGTQVADFRTAHEGRGRFSFTPVKGQTYTLRVTEPASVKKTVPLSEVLAEGATLSSSTETTPAGQPVKLQLGWTGDRVVKVSLYQRELELSTVTVDASKQRGGEISLDAKDAEGVLMATVMTRDGVPLAERLVFREPKKQLTVKLEADRPRFVPGAPVTLKIRTLLDGKPAAAFVGLTVTDDAVQELIERREQAPALPTMVFIENEVRELADAHVYLDSNNPKAKQAVDLLLGTQGWRRFARFDVGTFVARSQDAARRALAIRDAQSELMEDLAEASSAVAGGGPMDKDAVRRGPVPPPPMAARPMPAAVPVAPPAPAKPAPAPVAQAVAAAPKREVAAAEPEMEKAREAKAERAPRGRADDAFRKMAAPALAAPMAFVTVREYAHQTRPERKANDRVDFAETLFWSAATRTDANGEATVKFGLSDAVTSFRAAADGYTASGVIGAAQLKLESVKPFYVEPKLPLEVTEGDVIRLPIAFVNGTREPLQSVSLAMNTTADLRFSAPSPFVLQADERARRVVEMTVGPKSRTADLTLNTTAGGYSDSVTRPLSIRPRGFPIQQSSGGLLTANGKASFSLTLAPDTVPGSVTTSIAIYPSPAGNLSTALKALVQEPSGCFEQTSSTAYPMTMALQYFKTHSGSDPALIKDAQEKLTRGYDRLIGFECKEKGYEWFGQDPGHEALTAYGILEFTDMSKVRAVDASMLGRSRQWLLAQRDGKGGFERKRRALHTWVEEKDTSDAYITWALLEAGEKELSREVKRVKEAGLSSANTYVVAVAANVALLSGDGATAKTLLRKLAEKQNDKGMVGGGTQSIVGSTGRSLEIETTSLATLAWLKSGNDFVGPTEKAIKGLAEASTDGSYGATQSTVLALRAVLEYDRVRSASRKPGKVRLFVDGKPLGAPVAYDGTTQTELSFIDASELLSVGTHTLELQQEGGGQLPYSMAVRSNRVKPESSAETKVGLDVTLSGAAFKEGDVVEATARVTNTTDAQLPTVVAIVGVPGGLEPRIDQLKELVKAKTIDAYEVMGRDVVLYWRGMTPKQQVRVPVSLVASVPGKYVGPASRAYLYYGNEHKVWVAGLTADVAAKN